MSVHRSPSKWAQAAWLMALLFVAGCGPAEDSEVQQKVDAAVKTGNEHLEKGELDEAIAAFSEAVDLHAKSVEALEGRAAARTQKEEYAAAASDYVKLLGGLDPDSTVRYRMLLGKCHVAVGDYAEAVKDYQIVVAPHRDPENGEAHWRLAKALELLNDPTRIDLAPEHYAKAKELGYEPPAEEQPAATE